MILRRSVSSVCITCITLPIAMHQIVCYCSIQNIIGLLKKTVEEKFIRYIYSTFLEGIRKVAHKTVILWGILRMNYTGEVDRKRRINYDIKLSYLISKIPCIAQHDTNIRKCFLEISLHNNSGNDDYNDNDYNKAFIIRV